MHVHVHSCTCLLAISRLDIDLLVEKHKRVSEQSDACMSCRKHSTLISEREKHIPHGNMIATQSERTVVLIRAIGTVTHSIIDSGEVHVSGVVLI